MTAFMLVFFMINICISVYNWDDEIDWIKITAKDSKGIALEKLRGWSRFNPFEYFRIYKEYIFNFYHGNTKLSGAVTLFILDFVVTSSSATLFQFGSGTTGAGAIMFMSNILSAVFLIPKKEDMARVRKYQRNLKKKRWIWFYI